MSDAGMCECGHWDSVHKCEMCSCTEYEAKEQPVSDSKEQWLDAPSGDGWWWRASTATEPVHVVGDVFYQCGSESLNAFLEGETE